MYHECCEETVWTLVRAKLWVFGLELAFDRSEYENI